MSSTMESFVNGMMVGPATDLVFITAVYLWRGKLPIAVQWLVFISFAKVAVLVALVPLFGRGAFAVVFAINAWLAAFSIMSFSRQSGVERHIPPTNGMPLR